MIYGPNWPTNPADMPEDPQHLGKHINPATGIWPVCEWAGACMRGFVRSEMFNRGSDQVIKGTNRATTRKWRQLGSAK